MKFSIIIPYRDRRAHLDIVIPRLREHFTARGLEHEIIIAEQADNKKFRRGNLRNVGAVYATGDILVFHDVDYYPSDNVTYWNGNADVYLPVKRVIFTYNDLKEKPLHEVPGGYRHFQKSVDDNFFGGAYAFKKEIFFKVNGFSTRFVGWGFEDVDLYNRVTHSGAKLTRSSDGLFYALDHEDSGPPPNDPDFLNNISMAQNWAAYQHIGVNDMRCLHMPVASRHDQVDLWIDATDFDPPKPESNIVFSTFDFGDDE